MALSGAEYVTKAAIAANWGQGQARRWGHAAVASWTPYSAAGLPTLVSCSSLTLTLTLTLLSPSRVGTESPTSRRPSRQPSTTYSAAGNYLLGHAAVASVS